MIILTKPPIIEIIIKDPTNVAIFFVSFADRKCIHYFEIVGLEELERKHNKV